MASDNQVTRRQPDRRPRAAVHAQRGRGLQVPDRRQPPHPRRRRWLEGRRSVVLHGQLLAQPRRERGRVAHARHACGRGRPTQLPLLGEPGRRQAHRHRDRGRRGRPEPGDGPPRASSVSPARAAARPAATGASASRRPWVAAAPTRRRHRCNATEEKEGPKRRRDKDDKGWQKKGNASSASSARTASTTSTTRTSSRCASS